MTSDPNLPEEERKDRVSAPVRVCGMHAPVSGPASWTVPGQQPARASRAIVRTFACLGVAIHLQWRTETQSCTLLPPP